MKDAKTKALRAKKEERKEDRKEEKHKKECCRDHKGHGHKDCCGE